MSRKIRIRWDLGKPPQPETFIDTESNDYPSFWRGEPVTLGLSFLESGQLGIPDVESMSLIVRQHQKADGSHLYVQTRDGAITTINNEAFNTGADQVEFALSSAITASWSCDNRMRRPLWVVIAAKLSDGDQLHRAGWINLHESSTGIGGGASGLGSVEVAPSGLVDRVGTVDATEAAVMVTIPGPAIRQQASIASGTGQLLIDGVALPEGVALDRAPAGALATYSPVEVTFPIGTIGAVSYTALTDLGPIE